MNPRRYATLSEAAEYLRVDEKTIRRYISQGQLAGYRLGRRLIRVDLNEVDTQLMRPIPTVRREAKQ
jgi:excisionase family DNA binding protein